MTSPHHMVSVKQYTMLKKYIQNSKTLEELYKNIVNGPFQDKLLSTIIDLGIVVLLLVDDKKKIKRVALSDTEQAQGAVKVSAKPFHEIQIPLSSKQNIIAQAINQKELRITEDWNDLFTPALSSSSARLNQSAASIETSLVQPLSVTLGGAMIFSFYQPLNSIGDEHRYFTKHYAELVSARLT